MTRVLVTGASGTFGKDIVRRLVRRGVDVVAFARRPPVLPSVSSVAGDIRDAAAVEAAMRGCDVVAHLAWSLEPLPTEEENRAVNVGGTANVLEAMRRTGCARLVFASSVMAYGSHADNPEFLTEDDPLRPDPRIFYASNKAEVERLIAEAGVPAVVSRTAITLSRETAGYVERLFGAPVLVGVRGVDSRWQLVHQEDVGRFHVEACLGERTGTVNLAAPAVLDSETFAAALGRRHVSVPKQLLDQALTFTWEHGLFNVDPATIDGLVWPPVVDTTRLTEEWGFRCTWTGPEAAQDLGRVLKRLAFLGSRQVDAPWRLPWTATDIPSDLPPADGHALVDSGPDGVRGELDTKIDPEFPVFSAANLSEAFPGPMTALSLDVTLHALRGAAAMTSSLLGLDDRLARELTARAVVVAGHRCFAGVSILRELARAMPGWSEQDVDSQYMGLQRTEAPPSVRRSPRELVHEAAVGARVARRLVPRLLAVRKEADRLRVEIDTLDAELADVRSMDDERLAARLALAHDLAVQAWNASSFAVVVVGGALSTAQRVAGDAGLEALRVGTERLASAAPLRAVHELAAVLRDDAGVAKAVAAERTSVGDLRASSQAFARALDRALVAVGHRGPGEGELANPMFADAPELLVQAALAAAAQPAPAAPAPVELPARARAAVTVARRTMQTREHARDVSVRAQHVLRRFVRERGRRLAAAGVVSSADDVFHLTWDELMDPPAGAAGVVSRRQAERERLAGVRLPDVFEGSWEPVPSASGRAAVGEVLEGLGACAGQTRGRVRILVDPYSADLEPGDVLVTRVTDTGWTPLFAAAAAVVTDVGALASHAAVVAREFGIPCVVGAAAASERLRDGDEVLVDGAAGTVARTA